MLAMYLLGFGIVWGIVALGCATVAGYRHWHFDQDWDRAFVRELEPVQVRLLESRSSTN
jgi:hypothetical protein